MDKWIGNTKISKGLCPACSNPEMERRAFPIIGDVIMVCTTCNQVYPNDRAEAWAKLHQKQGTLAAITHADVASDEDLHNADATEGTHLRHEMSFQAFMEKKDAKTNSEPQEIPTRVGTGWVTNDAEYRKRQIEEMANRFNQDFERIKDMETITKNPTS
jgi:hypothetical protein